MIVFKTHNFIFVILEKKCQLKAFEAFSRNNKQPFLASLPKWPKKQLHNDLNLFNLFKFKV
jgi:hypothetical protein